MSRPSTGDAMRCRVSSRRRSARATSRRSRPMPSASSPNGSTPSTPNSRGTQAMQATTRHARKRASRAACWHGISTPPGRSAPGRQAAALRDLNAAVYDARTRETASGRARAGAPERNAALGARVGALAAAGRCARAPPRKCQGRAGPAPRGHRGTRAGRPAQAPRRILDPGALCARDHLRPCRRGQRARKAAEAEQP